MAINLQPTFIPNLSSEKTSGCQIKEKKFMFESISMAGASTNLFKHLSLSIFEGKINEGIIFRLVRLKFFNVGIIQVIVSGKRFLFDSIS